MIPQSKTTRYFCQVLFYATILPFFLGLLTLAYAHQVTPKQYLEINPVQYAVIFMATIHVPLTIYLFFDAAIRQRIQGDPIKFILAPAMILIVSIAIFTGSTEPRADHNASALAYVSLGILAWNLWHFGKQNIGVYSYYRLGNAGRMLQTEKRMIYLGAVLGAISAIILGFDSYISNYSEHSRFVHVIALTSYVTGVAQYVQYALTAVSLLYVARYRERFDIKTTAVFLICVNFFLPAYISIGDTRWASVFSIGSLSHGLQYVAFLLFHSFNTTDGFQRKLKVRSRSAPMMTVFLVITGLVLGELYMFHAITRHIDVTGLMPSKYWLSFVDGLTNGVLLNHFWFDSFFWRFNNPSARQWMIDRYSFLFPPRAGSQ